MNAETKPEHIGQAESILLRIPDSLRGGVIRDGVRKIIGFTTYEYPSEYTQKIQEAAQKGPIIVTINHTSHTDFAVAAVITADITHKANKVLSTDKKIEGFVMPLALSLAIGKQGKLLSMLYNELLPLLADFGVEPILTPTENDLIQGRITKVEYEKARRKFAKEMLTAVGHKKKSILIAPEGRVEGGRIDEKTGKIKGLQEFRKGSIHQTLRTATSQYDNATIIPIGISGGYKVYDPQGKRLTSEALRVGLGLSFQSLMSVKIGEPIVFSKNEIQSLDSDFLDLQMGRGIAKLLPHEERGEVYANVA
jgi:1-acyl-sn-glycerol-3-phosphate acyltransferase